MSDEKPETAIAPPGGSPGEAAASASSGTPPTDVPRPAEAPAAGSSPAPSVPPPSTGSAATGVTAPTAPSTDATPATIGTASPGTGDAARPAAPSGAVSPQTGPARAAGLSDAAARGGAAWIEEEPPGTIDWPALLPETPLAAVGDALKLLGLAIVVMNVYAVWHGSQVTRPMALGAAGAGLGLLAAWKVYAGVAEAFGRRVVGATYGVLGVLACVLLVMFAAGSGSVHESRQLKAVIALGGLVCLYPAALGLATAVTGKEPTNANPLGIPLSPRWFGTLRVLFSREVHSFFTTAIPYLFFAVFLAINGALFFFLLSYFTQAGAGDRQSATTLMFNNIFIYFSIWLICPAITMRLVAEEKRLGTIETLLTAPVTDIQVILAKFFGAMTFFAAMLSFLFLYLVILSLHAKDWDWGPVYASFLAILLWGGLNMSIGLFWSTLTENQLVAFIVTAATNAFLFFLHFLENYVKEDQVWFGFLNVKGFVHYMSLYNHYQELTRGIVSTKSLVFFGCGIGFALFAAIRGLESQRWR